MRLQTILKPNKAICDVKELYFHESDGLLDVDGFFNLFYIKKHKHYTNLKKLRLKLRLRGWSSIKLMHNREEISELGLEPEQLKCYEFELPYENYDEGVFWFRLLAAEKSYSPEPEENALNTGTAANIDTVTNVDTDTVTDTDANTNTNTSIDIDMDADAFTYTDEGKPDIKAAFFEGCYEGISSEEPRKVNIAVDICTYKREQYVLRNMQSICRYIYEDKTKEVRENLNVLLIHNGKTLSDNEELSAFTEKNTHIRIYTNENAGGAGGFTRGMLEALKDKECTHILLMDDDAVFDPDIFVRLYGFLSMLKEERKDITVGGALMREELPYCQFASGEQYRKNKAYNPYPKKDLRIYDNCVSSYMCEPLNASDMYSGWWCCCFSTKTVTKDNLPLPIFIHCDDIEYGLRNQDKGMVFVNGICVWHRGQEHIIPGANRYYDIRNKLIMNALHKTGFNKADALWIVYKAMTASLMSHRYEEGKFAYSGLIDFCRGSSWLMNTNAEGLNNELRSGMHFQTKDMNALTMYIRAFITIMLSFDKAKADYRRHAAELSSADMWKKYLKLPLL